MEENKKRSDLIMAKHLASMHKRVLHELTQSWSLQPELSRLQDSVHSFMQNRPSIDIEDLRSRVIAALTRFEKAHEENEDFLYGFDYYTRIPPNERIHWTNHALLRILATSKKFINEAYQEGIDISTFPTVKDRFFRMANGYFISKNLAKVKAFKHEINEETTKRKSTPSVEKKYTPTPHPSKVNFQAPKLVLAELAVMGLLLRHARIIRGNNLTKTNLAKALCLMSGYSETSFYNKIKGVTEVNDIVSKENLRNVQSQFKQFTELIDKELAK
jgi:hypothetical protein